jgi:hyaluronoglucosaminidase
VPFKYRGVVEGFYGTPWSHADRLWMIERLGRWGMNRYVYAPKNDPLNRDRWREPYPDHTLREFEELVAWGGRHGVGVGFAISPGLSIRYGSREDRVALLEKLGAFTELGARFVSLALDDVPFELAHEADVREFGSLAAAHVALAHEVRERLGAGVALWLVPTDYLGVGPSDYLEALGASLDPEIEVGWTGRTVVSPSIEAGEARRRAQTLRRRLLLWDNVPVSDGPMRSLLHLGPYAGRAKGLHESACGVLLNPMEHAHASAVAIRTASVYLADPEGYDPEAAWREALAEVGEGAPDAFALFAAGHRFSPQWIGDRDRELEAGLEALRRGLRACGPVTSELEALDVALQARLEASGTLRKNLADRRLAEELEPWLVSHRAETRRMQAALGALQKLLAPDASRMSRTFTLFAMEAALAAEPEPNRVSYGPRRVLYPQLASMREGEMGFGEDPALVRDRNLAEELVRLVEDLALARLRGESSAG